MNSERRQKLIDLGAEFLADALLELAVNSDAAAELIKMVTSSPEENVQRMRNKLSELKYAHEYFDWEVAEELLYELETLLENIRSEVKDPLIGVELVAAFFEADDGILGCCDDSYGEFSDLFRTDAKALFVHYASGCTDKEKISDIILNLNIKDGYGVRSTLIECAGEFLPEKILRSMVTRIQKRADEEKEEYEKRHQLMLIEFLARQLRDAKLFEETRVASHGMQNPASIIDIARVYLECGNAETAHLWLKKIPEVKSYHSDERDELLEETYRMLGDTEKLIELLYQKFMSNHSTETLQALQDEIGDDKIDQILDDEVTKILKADGFEELDAVFLVSIGKIDKAEDYLLKHAYSFDGTYYDTLLQLAEVMESERCYLAASLIYRSLLISILNRGYSKAYRYGIRYLKKLDKLSVIITDWKEFSDHKDFKEEIILTHNRKRSFWSGYDQFK